MSKRWIIVILLCVAALVAAVFAFTGCDNNKGDEDDKVVCEDHTWAVESRTEAKCYAEGSQVLVCENCGETMTQALPKSAHKIAMVPAKDPTCTKAGNTAGNRCITPGCGYVEGNVSIPKTGHTEVPTPAKAATCTEMGYSEGGTHCSTCYTILSEPDETYPTIGHVYVPVDRIEPTCATEGSVGGTRCESCGKVGEEPTEILDKLEEHSAELVIVSRASCTTDGYKECPVCGAQEIFEYKNSSLHNFTTVATEAVNPDCTTATNGKTAVYQCSNPGCEMKVGGVEISWETLHGEALEWTETIPATETSAGERVATCEVCGQSFREDIPKLSTGSGDFNDDNNIYEDDVIGNKKDEEDGE